MSTSSESRTSARFAMEETETLPSLTPPSIAMCEWQSMIPGITNWPAASITLAPAGALIDGPTSAILPSLIRIDPFFHGAVRNGENGRVLDQDYGIGVQRRWHGARQCRW